MAARTPEEVHLKWVEATNAGDVEAVMSLYEPDSGIVNTSGELVTGLSGVRQVVEGLLALRPQFDLRVARVVECGDIALLLSPWTMSGTADGNPLTSQGTTTDVVRRQSDGTWLFVMDNPTGVAILDGAGVS